jgi:DNA polymerase-1
MLAVYVLQAYFARYPKVRAYLDAQIEQARRLGYVQTLLGRRRYIPEMASPDPMIRQLGERMAINAPIQGTAADLIKHAMIQLAEALSAKRLRSRMILQVHDELVCEGPIPEREELVQWLRSVMEHAIELSVPVRVTVKTGPNWLELTDVG